MVATRLAPRERANCAAASVYDASWEDVRRKQWNSGGRSGPVSSGAVLDGEIRGILSAHMALYGSM